jgi:leucyl aminopeptidase (aminopeptidase T)
MANLPGGEAFVTPESVKGTFVGDVVISIDQSYLLSEKNPLVVECSGDKYKIISGPKDIIEKLEKKKEEARQLTLNQEKFKSIPQEIIDLKKNNFSRIGEFAINTNPSAQLCEYLIVNEKIARMIHLALGSGFEPDRATDYHTDIVINAPRQKLDIYGIDEKGNKHWILKKGEFVV